MNIINSLALSRLVVLCLSLTLFSLSKCSKQSIYSNSPSVNKKSKVSPNEKQKGAHVFGRLDSLNIQQFKENKYEWITLVAYSGQQDIDSPELRYRRGDSTALLERNARWLKEIKIVHEAGYKVFVKPHIWLRSPPDGKWRSDIFPTSEENWEIWKKSYREFILRYAKLAERGQAEMFCVGVELTRLTLEKPKYWQELIKEVRTIYSGKITYAANCDLEFVANKYNRPILFTEMGYKSTADAAIKPWEWIEYDTDQKKVLSTETQANCYQAFFDTIWDQEWFAGTHIWQLRSDFKKGRGKSNLDFTPQEKPAEKTIARGFEGN